MVVVCVCVCSSECVHVCVFALIFVPGVSTGGGLKHHNGSSDVFCVSGTNRKKKGGNRKKTGALGVQ